MPTVLSRVAVAASVLVVSSAAMAQSLPGAGRGRPDPVPAETVARFPVNTFLESVAVAADGTIFFNSHDDGVVYRLPPGASAGAPPARVAQVRGKLAGLAPERAGSLLASGWDEDGAPTVFRIHPADSRSEALLRVQGAEFLNGFAHLGGDLYALADSYRGLVWAFDAGRRTAEIWMQDAAFERHRADGRNPGVNGLKVFGGHLYASNSDRAHIVRVRLSPDGLRPAGRPEPFVEGLMADDFAFDARGNLYLATHPLNSVVRIAPDGRDIAVLGTVEQGLAGSTAVAFGHGASDRDSIYVTTNGGMFLPPPTGVVPAELVRLRVGVEGAPVLR